MIEVYDASVLFYKVRKCADTGPVDRCYEAAERPSAKIHESDPVSFDRTYERNEENVKGKRNLLHHHADLLPQL